MTNKKHHKKPVVDCLLFWPWLLFHRLNVIRTSKLDWPFHPILTFCLISYNAFPPLTDFAFNYYLSYINNFVNDIDKVQFAMITLKEPRICSTFLLYCIMHKKLLLSAKGRLNLLGCIWSILKSGKSDTHQYILPHTLCASI